jgi:hypothetical protein
MTVADKIGQLFLVTFMGNDVSGSSDIATLGVTIGWGWWQPQRQLP